MDDTIFMNILLYYADQQQKKKNVISEDKRCRRRRRRFRAYLSADGKRRRDRRIPRVSLRMPYQNNLGVSQYIVNSYNIKNNVSTCFILVA